MSQAFSTEYATMQHAQAMFQSKHQEMVQLLDALEADLQSRLGRWEDDARDAYFEAKGKWDKVAREQADTVKEFGESVGAAHHNYKSAEGTNTQMWA
ncbi:WXG100 family type VII secretion target [Actinomadura decatromicini]|uniref:WXG100 family type VII secretion target n=1 Tax=Actinomadura decatromicini TaxID=2604572 RepID=A0A5D3F7C4_9ACTN|nr:WXG100 family type VII secretion target [Actinomadura decatromicini]TYK43716.1 WXG100 family type VII secretion target [Actinomadura decatromicini]